MNLILKGAAIAMLMTLSAVAEPLTSNEIATRVLAPLLGPVKIATLKGDRPVNARLYRILGWLETARLAGGELTEVIDTAQGVAGHQGTTVALMDRAALCRSWRQLEQFGCFTPEGIAALKKGRSPKINRGLHAGDTVHLDHILPRSVVLELDASFHNLRPVPSRMNRAKAAKVGPAELELARRWHRKGILSEMGLQAVEQAGLRDVEYGPSPKR